MYDHIEDIFPKVRNENFSFLVQICQVFLYNPLWYLNYMSNVKTNYDRLLKIFGDFEEHGRIFGRKETTVAEIRPDLCSLRIHLLRSSSNGKEPGQLVFISWFCTLALKLSFIHIRGHAFSRLPKSTYWTYHNSQRAGSITVHYPSTSRTFLGIGSMSVCVPTFHLLQWVD